MGAAGLLATGLLQLSRTPLEGTRVLVCVVKNQSGNPYEARPEGSNKWYLHHCSRAAIAKTTLATSPTRVGRSMSRLRGQGRSTASGAASWSVLRCHRHRCHRSQSGYEQRRTPTRAFPSLSRRAPRFLLARASLLGAAGSGPVMSHRAGTPDRS